MHVRQRAARLRGEAGSGRPAAQVIRRNYPKHSQGFTWVHSGISRATLMVSGRPIGARSPLNA